MKSRDLIIISVTIILLLSIGIFALFNTGGPAETAVLKMTSNSSLSEGDSISFVLTDGNGTPIANQRIELNLTGDNGITENFTFKTNSKGECRLEDLIAGKFKIIAKYNGNSKYKQSSTSGEITVSKKASKNTSSSSSSPSSYEEFKSDYKVDDVIDGWDPSEHEVSREELGDGATRIEYDDGYFRIVDEEGHILNYGY